MTEQSSAKAQLGAELSKIRATRRDLTYDALIRTAAGRGAKLTASSLSDWFRGHSVPDDRRSFVLLVEMITGARPSDRLMAVYEAAGKESMDRRGARRPRHHSLEPASNVLSEADVSTIYKLPLLDTIHYANVVRLNILLAAYGHPAGLGSFPALCDRTMTSTIAVMESISQRLAKVELPLKRLTPEFDLRTLRDGDIFIFDRMVNTLNGPRPGGAYKLTGDLDVDPLIYIKRGGVRIVMPYDPNFVTTSTAYSDFMAGQTPMFGLCKVKRRGRPDDAPRRAKKPKVQFVASPLVLGQTALRDRDPELRRSLVMKGIDPETDSVCWIGPWNGMGDQT